MSEVRKHKSYEEFRNKRSGGLQSYKFEQPDEQKVSGGGAFGAYKYGPAAAEAEKDDFNPLTALIEAITNIKL